MLKGASLTSLAAAPSAGQPASRGTTEEAAAALATAELVPSVKCTRRYVPAAALKQRFLSSPAAIARYTALTVSAKTETIKDQVKESLKA